MEQWWHKHSLHVREKCYMSNTLRVISKTVISRADTDAQCENSLLLVCQKPQQGYEHEKAKGVAPIVIKLFWLGNRKLSGLSMGTRKTVYVQMQGKYNLHKCFVLLEKFCLSPK